MISHGFVINDLRSSSIVRILKSKSIICKYAQYKSIALSSIIGNITMLPFMSVNIIMLPFMELRALMLLERCSDYFFTSDMQFGLNKLHYTNTMILKQLFIIHPIVVQFLCVFHAKLFVKIIKRKLSYAAVRYLVNL
jgi:hypothetical protein